MVFQAQRLASTLAQLRAFKPSVPNRAILNVKWLNSLSHICLEHSKYNANSPGYDRTRLVRR